MLFRTLVRLRLLACFIIFISPLWEISNCADSDRNQKDDPVKDNSARYTNEPAFPSLIGTKVLGRHVMHIIAESYSIQNGVFRNVEEFVNVFTGKSLITTTINGHRSSLLYDAELGVRYEYSLFTCKTLTFQDLIERNKAHSGLWNCKTTLYFDGGSLEKLFEMNGLLAIWMNGNTNHKTYTKRLNDYRDDGRTKELPQTVHEWCMDDKENLRRFCLAFIRNRYEVLILDKIEILSSETGALVESYKVIAFERLSESPFTEDIMKPPAGYGCDFEANHQNSPISLPTVKEGVILDPREDSFEMKLEITATRYDTKRLSEGNEVYQFEGSQTSYVEVAFARPQDMSTGFPYHMMRIRNSQKDLKSVADYNTRTQYLINTRDGSCKIHSMFEDLQSFEPKKNFEIKFTNGMEIDLDMDTMDRLFFNNDGYNYVKSTVSQASLENSYYFEKVSQTLFPGKIARVVRYYSAKRIALAAEDYGTKLESLTALLLDSKRKLVEGTFHIRIIDVDSISLRRSSLIFDVSEECYLNNDQMRPGQDYSWFQIGYNLNPSQAMSAASNQEELLNIIREQLASKTDLNFFRVPRIELMLQPGGFQFRILVLDYLPIELRYIAQPKTAFKDDLVGPTIQRDVAIDLKHCAELCRLQNCQAVSFCQDNFSCILSMKYDREEAKKSSIVTKSNCHLFVKPADKKRVDKKGVETILNFPLAQIISELSHTNFLAFQVPEIPEELTLDKDDFNPYINRNYFTIMEDYLANYVKVLSDWPPLVRVWHFGVMLGGQFSILRPSKFVVESDPFAVLDDSLSKDSIISVDRQKAQATFETGKPSSRYDVKVLNDLSDVKWVLYGHFNYDQCALACLDQNCQSFSYCSESTQCVITDKIQINANFAVRFDHNCVIMQRNYLDKFQKFSNVYRSIKYKSKIDNSLNPAQCALACFMESSFKCLAFDYCVPKDSISPSSCLMLEQRSIFSPSDHHEAPVEPADQKLIPSSESGTRVTTGCDHYSRSYLADFLRIENRKLKDDQEALFMTLSVVGKSIDRCAEICANELKDCSAFQFCLNRDNPSVVIQFCTMIEGTIPKSLAGNQVVIESKQNDQVLEVGSIFETSPYCHMYALLEGDSAILPRPKAIELVAKDELNRPIEKPESSTSISFFKGIAICLGMAFAFTLLTTASCYAKNHNSYLKQRYEHARILVNLRR